MDLLRLRASGIASIAIVFMHGFRHVAHERRAAALARGSRLRRGDRFARGLAAHPFRQPRRHHSRGCLPDAPARALRPRIPRGHSVRATASVRLEFMQSNGGLVAPEAFRACNAVLSGPAGGLVATARIAESLGRRRLIAFDMGGTSTDVALYDGAMPQRFETSHRGRAAPGADDEHSYGRRRRRLGARVRGRPSARRAAIRGLAARSRMLSERRPALGHGRAGAARPDPAGRFPGDIRGGRRPAARFRHRAAECSTNWPPRCPRRSAAITDAVQLASGFLDVAIESMARAIRHVSVREGHDPADFALCCYGGAAPQHACRVADCLGYRRDPDSSAGRRAVGLGHRPRGSPARSASEHRAAAREH